MRNSRAVLWGLVLTAVTAVADEPDTATLPWSVWGRTGDGVAPSSTITVPGADVLVQPNAVYLMLDERPASGRLELPRLTNIVRRAWWWPRSDAKSSGPSGLHGSEYVRPFVPPAKRTLRFSQNATAWSIALPAGIEYPAVVVLDVIGQPRMLAETPPAKAGADGVIVLPAPYARTHGEKLQFEPLTHKNTVGYWVNPNDWAEWRVTTEAADEYEVHVLQGCGGGQGGSRVSVSAGEASVEFDVLETGHFQNFRWRKVGRIALPAGESTVELRCRKLANRAVMDVRQIRLVSVEAAIPASRDLRVVEPDAFVPPLFDGQPGSGKRVLRTAPGFEKTRAYHVLSLPTNWRKGRRYPVLVELAGNGPFRNPQGDVSTGRVEDASLGHGLAGGDGFIVLSLPYLNDAGTTNVTQWWGSPPKHDPQPTLKYLHAAINETCERFGGDADRLVLVGFSRGAIACNALGLHDDETAALWRGFVGFSHYDGVKSWPPPGTDRESALTRLRRLGDRPQFLVAETRKVAGAALADVKTYLQSTGVKGDFTFAETGFRNHDDRWVLRPSPTRTRIREWLATILEVERKP